MDLKQVNESLNFYIRPQTFPLALKLCPSQSELPEKVRIPMRDLGYQITLCQGIGLARRFGWTMAIGREDQCCIGGAAAMGFVSEAPAMPQTSSDKTLDFGKYSIVARTHHSDECQFILPSGGDRVFGSTHDHEVIFTMPRSKIEAVIKGLEDTHNAGFRYPILTDLRHRPALPPFLEMPQAT